nr:hypothetical protein [Marinicella sp. W31]MDC2876887.1 hypothetical protein [Marinicella sp. W31]
MQRTDFGVGYNSHWFDTALDYTNIQAQPGYSFDERNSEIKSTSRIRLNDNWNVAGSITYDLANNVLTNRWVGLTYEDICTIFSITYQEDWDNNNREAVDWTIGARLTFRTLGDIAIGSDPSIRRQQPASPINALLLPLKWTKHFIKIPG